MFGGMKGLGDMAGLMAKAQEMQTKAAELQEELERIEVEGQSGAGMVVATTSAKGRLMRLKIDPSLIKSDEAEVMEDLIVAAINDAQEKAQARSQEEMQKLTAGLPIPPGMMG